MNEIQRFTEEQATQWIRASGLEIEAVSNVSEFCHVVARFFRESDSGQKWIFRGEDKLHKSPATPSIFRVDSDDNPPTFSRNSWPDKSITDQEIEQVKQCQEDHLDGSDRYIKAFMPSMHAMDVNWLPLTRHFGYETRLLDVSVNPLVALYFACISSPDNNAYVYAMQTGGFRPVNTRNPVMPDTPEYPHIPISYLDLYDVDKEFHEDGYDRLPYIYEASIPQERLQAQGGLFLFWRNSELQLPRERQLVPVRISSSAKNSILSELTAFGVTSSVLFPNE